MWTTALVAAKAFIGKHPWIIGLALALALIHALGNTIVDVTAYLQPRVTVVTKVVKQETVRDRSIITERETRRPDGTVEMLREVKASVDRMTVDKMDSENVREPVALAGKESSWLLQGGYAPLGRQVSLGVGFQLFPALVLGVQHEVVRLGEDLSLPDRFSPVIWVTWRLDGII